MVTVDTIAAVATPPGRGGVGVVRISGPRTRLIAERLLGCLPPPRHARYGPFLDPEGNHIDIGIALFFPAPHSFTGEDVLELQGHGGPVVMDLLLRAVVAAGARTARPGEFSERAFLNGKLDLAQAEAVADLIDSASEAAARGALRSLQGEFSRCIDTLLEELIELRTYVEAAIDFPEEEVDFLSEGDVAGRLGTLQRRLAQVEGSARQGALLREGLTVVLAGRPNAGKSSLLNRLAGREAAIVTDIPGTTRDILREGIQIDGLPIHLLDTAGLREGSDPVEREGVRRAWAAIAAADRVLLLVDDTLGLGEAEREILTRLPPRLPVTVVHNKIDRTGRAPACEREGAHTHLFLSARTEEGLELLRDHLKEVAGFRAGESGVFMARRRHLEALGRAASHLHHGGEVLRQWRAGELVAEELRLAQQALGEITGDFTSDDLLGAIFAGFCIGK